MSSEIPPGHKLELKRDHPAIDWQVPSGTHSGGQPRCLPLARAGFMFSKHRGTSLWRVSKKLASKRQTMIVTGFRERGRKSM